MTAQPYSSPDPRDPDDHAETVRRLKGGKRFALRETIDKAALKVRSRSVDAPMPVPTGNLTKAERLARDTGSEEERRSTRGSVAKAAERVAAEHPDVNLNTPDTRTVLEKLRQAYPGKSLGDIVAQAEHFDAAMRDDPVQGRQMLLEHYASFAPEHFSEFKPVKQADGLRGSIQRATQDQADAADLRAAQAKYGAHLPHILQQLERFDSSLRENPAAASARIATSQGAPATERQIPAYQAKQAHKQAAKAYGTRLDALNRHIQEGIAGGHIPGDAATLGEMAAVLQNPRFKHHPTDATDTLRRAAAVATHPDHVRLTGKHTGKSGASLRGTRSISGGSPSAGHVAPRGPRTPGSGGVRDSINRAFAR